MSATYRIELRRDPHSSRLPWDAVIVRLSDDERVTICTGSTYDRALIAAREWVRDEEGTVVLTGGRSRVYVDDQGRDAEAPQSVRV